MSDFMLQASGDDSVNLTLNATAEFHAAEGDQPARVTIRAYDGNEMVVPPHGPVVVESALLELSDSIPLLSDHVSLRSGVVGAGTPKVNDDGSIEVTGTLSRATEAGREILGLHADGVKWQASIGVRMNLAANRKLRPGQTLTANGKTFTAGPRGLTHVRGGKLKEVSIVIAGADDDSVVEIAATDNPKPKRSPNMDPEFRSWLEANGYTEDAYNGLTEKAQSHLKATYTAEQADNDPPADEFEAMIGKRKAERERRQAITAIVERETGLWPSRIDEIEAIAEVALNAGTQPRDFELELLRSVRPVGPPNTPRGKSTGQEQQIIEAAVAQAVGLQDLDKHYSDEVLSAADAEFKYGIGLQQLLFRAAAQHGQRFDSAANLRGLLAAAFGRTPDGQMLQAAGGFSTFSLPGIFANVLNKGLADYFNTVENVWSRIAATRSTNDYKEVKTYSLTGDMTYQVIPPSGQIPHSELGETSYSNRAQMHGRMIALSHEDITNDDLGALDTIRMRMGRGGALAIAEAFWTAFMDNATFWTTVNGGAIEGADTDLAGSDPGEALNKAETAFRKQTDPDGKPLAVTPRILLTPPELANHAATLMGSQRIVSGTDGRVPDSNVYAGRYSVESSQYLSNAAFTGNSATAWYLLASPLDMPVIQVVYLRNRRRPLVESAEADFDELGIRVRGTFAFGVAKQEYRGGVRAKGAA